MQTRPRTQLTAAKTVLPRVTDISALRKDLGGFMMESFWLFVMTEGNEDEAEICD